MDIKFLTKKELENFCITNEMLQENNGYNVYHYKGFHYFSRRCFKDNSSFLCAFEGNQIIGLIEVGEWYDMKQCVSFIDVHRDFRRQGVATKMIIELNNYVNIKYPLYITHESEEGKKCHIHNCFKNNINVCNILKTE